MESIVDEDHVEFTVVENEAGGRFELQRNGELVGFANYSQQDDRVVVPHVETLYQHRGQGYAAKLMAGTLDILRSSNRTITPLCPFAARYMGENPDQADLLTSLRR